MPEKNSGVNETTPREGAGRRHQAAPTAALVYATFPDADVAERTAGELVALEIAACVNIFPAMCSIYRWQGQLEKSLEVAAFIKTQPALVERVIGALKASHPYANPAVLVLPVAAGSPEFLQWIVDETGGPL